MTDGVSITGTATLRFSNVIREPTNRSKDIQNYCDALWPISPSTPTNVFFPVLFFTWNAVSLICYVQFFYCRKKEVIYSEVQRRRVLGGVSIS